MSGPNRKSMVFLWAVIGILSLFSASLGIFLVGTTTRSDRTREETESLVKVRDQLQMLTDDLKGVGRDNDWMNHLDSARTSLLKAVAIDGEEDSTFGEMFAALGELRRQLKFAVPLSDSSRRESYHTTEAELNNSIYISLLHIQHLLGLEFAALRSRLQKIDSVESRVVLASLPGNGLLVVLLVIVFYREARRNEEYRKNLEIFGQTVSNYPGGIIVLTIRERDGNKEYLVSEANKAAEEMTGVEFSSIRGKDLATATHLTIDVGFIQAVSAVAETGSSIDFGERYYRDSIVREGWYSTKVFPLYKDTVGVSFEVVSRKKEMEIALRESEERWQLVVWGADDGIWDWDMAANSIFYSDRWYTITGYKRSDDINHLKDLEKLVYPEDAARVLDSLRKYISGEVIVFSEEYRLRMADGYYRWVHDRGQAIIDENGKVLRMAGSTSDIDTRKKTEEALSRERILLRTIIENLPDPVYAKDSTLRKSLTNPADVRNIGATSEAEILGKTDFEVYAADFARESVADDLTVLKRGTAVLNREESFISLNGEKRWLLTSKVPLRDEKGDIIGLVGVGHDITKRKLMEIGLRESERRLSDVIEFFPAPTMIVDSDGRVISWNRAMESVTGVKAAKMIGKDDYEYSVPFYGERRPILIDCVIHGDIEIRKKYQNLKEVGDTVRAETYVALPNGNEAYLLGFATALRNSKGEITGGIETLLDLSEIKRAETRLRASEERFRLISENVIDMITLLDSGYVCLYASPSYVHDGIDPNNLIGKLFLSYVHTDDIDTLSEVVQSVISEQRYRTVQFRFCGDGKNWRIKEATINSLLNENGEQVMVVMRDITDHVRHEKERQELENELQRRNSELERTVAEMKEIQKGLVQSEKLASIGQLVAGVAHEINNPLTFVYSNLNRFDEYFHEFLDLIHKWERTAEVASRNGLWDKATLNEVPSDEEKAEIGLVAQDFDTLMTQTKSGAERIKKIVEQLRGFTHLSDDSVTLADLNSALDDTLAIVWNEIKYKAVVKKEYGRIPKVTCNLGEIKQVFVNLLVNASQAIEERGEITIRTGVNTSYVYAEISDTGTGITPENLQKIFDPFFTTKPVGRGTGLGLWVSTSIIQKHAGRLSAESELGKGTKMTVMLPMDGEAN